MLQQVTKFPKQLSGYLQEDRQEHSIGCRRGSTGHMSHAIFGRAAGNSLGASEELESVIMRQWLWNLSNIRFGLNIKLSSRRRNVVIELESP